MHIIELEDVTFALKFETDLARLDWMEMSVAWSRDGDEEDPR